MKKKIICAVLILISFYARAGSCSANGTGNWETPGNWSCGHVPGAGDDAMISSGITITVLTNNLTDIGNLSISGTLQFTNGSKINLAATSVVNVFSGGSITGGNGGAKLVFPSTSYAGPFSTTGPFFFSNSGSGSGTLPLTLVSFFSSLNNQEVILYWRTENEENINSFEVQSSRNGNADWQDVGLTPSMATSGGGYSYTFKDQNKINGDKYYRLKIFDKDGKYTYSKVLFISSREAGSISIVPTLVESSVNVILPTSGYVKISIFNTTGQMVKSLGSETEVFTINLSGLGRGEYFLRASQGIKVYSAKFFKQ